MKKWLKKISNRVRAGLVGRLESDNLDLANRQRRTLRRISMLEIKLENIQEALGRIESRQLSQTDREGLQDNEFRVFSQWGEDGIIQYLLRHIPVQDKRFVEIGVEDYGEANTRFLLVKDNWSGLVIDDKQDNIDSIRAKRISYHFDLRAVKASITKENVNDILQENKVTGEIGLLSIDIDGNDYWIWDAITVINPIIVIVEYNYRFGKDYAVTVPYDEEYDRCKAHYSMIYFGASLKALCVLGEKKGYKFVGCNANGVNAFFVRKDLKPDRIPELTVEEGFVQGKFHETRNREGTLVQMSHDEEHLLLTTLPLYDISEDRLVYLE